MDAAVFTVTLPSGEIWTPKFAQQIDQNKCIGCGRCYRVCGRDVLQMAGVDEDGNFIPVALGADEDDDDDEEYEKKVMTIAHPENCVGCEACSKICPKKCYTNGPSAL